MNTGFCRRKEAAFRSSIVSHAGRAAALLFFASVFICVLSPSARAESRVYHLRVTLRSGERYETLSACDPFSYCSRHGGVVTYLKDYSLIYSPHMKVKILRTWIEPGDDLASRWGNILRTNGMLSNHNHKTLPKLQPLSLAQMCRPE